MRVMKTLAGVAMVAALAACTATPSPAPPKPSNLATPTPTPTPTFPPIELPEDKTPAPAGARIEPGTWGFITVPTDTVVGVRFNGLWHGAEGSLADRNITQPADGPQIDLTKAVPHFLSYSYVITSGDSQAAPSLDILPNLEGNLYEVTSALIGGRACPDYPGPTQRGIGKEVRVCLVSLSDNGGRPTALVGAVPGADGQFWFFNAPESTPLPPE